MIKIAHISDIHFGAEDSAAVEKIIEDIEMQKPRMIAVSGDLTQRAKSRQFEAAADFLDRLDYPMIVIPGNHDISLFNIFRRFYRPLKKFFKYISDDIFPEYDDDDMAAVGVNTARSLTWKGGRINEDQIREIENRFENKDDKLKVLILHHNISPSPGKKKQSFIGRAEMLLKTINKSQIDLILAGHVHTAYTKVIRQSEKGDISSIIVSAGTAVSKRVRGGEPNSYNIIKGSRQELEIEIRAFTGEKFTGTERKLFEKKNKHWDIKE